MCVLLLLRREIEKGAYNSNLCFIAVELLVELEAAAAEPLTTMADLLLMAMLLILLPFDRIFAALAAATAALCGGPYLALGPDF